MSRIGRLGCSHCGWTGVTKHSFWNGEKDELTATLCSQCKDTVGYSLYIKQKYSSVNNNLHVLESGGTQAVVIDFQIYKDLKEMKYYTELETAKMGKTQFEEFGEIPKVK